MLTTQFYLFCVSCVLPRLSALPSLGPHSNVDTGKVAVGQVYPVPSPVSYLCSCPELLVAAKSILPHTGASIASNPALEKRELLVEVEGCLRHRLEESRNREETKKSAPEKKRKNKKSDSKSELSAPKTKSDSIPFRNALASVLPFAHPTLLNHGLAIVTEGRESKIDNRNIDIDGDERVEHLKLLCAAGVECLKIVSWVVF